MSPIAPQIELPDGSKRLARKLTYKEARYVSRRIANPDEKQIESARQAGFPEWMCLHSTREIEAGLVGEVLAELQGNLAEHAVEAGLIDSVEIHEFLSDAIRARMSDIRNDDHSFKPRSQWPDIWDRLEEAGDVEVEYLSERSHDGATKDAKGGWDRIGEVQKVKFKFASKVKLLELAMKHKAVDAMVQQKAGDTNILVITADQARRVAKARQRLEKVIELKPEESQ